MPFGRMVAMSATYTYWQDPSDGMWLGYWNDYPDYQTQGHSHDELKHMLVSLRTDISEMIADGTMAPSRLHGGELAFA